MGKLRKKLANFKIQKAVNQEYLKQHKGYVNPKNGKRSKCWIWQGSLSNKGYGRCTESTHLGECLAHRFAYKQAYGELAEGYEPDHLCEIKACIRPSHLEAVTRSTNLKRNYSRHPELREQRKDQQLKLYSNPKELRKHTKRMLKVHEQNRHIHEAKRKLTDAQVLKIRKLRIDGWTYPALAKKFDIGNSSIWCICLGKTYKHLLEVS